MKTLNDMRPAQKPARYCRYAAVTRRGIVLECVRKPTNGKRYCGRHGTAGRAS
jgi:hypothetical protein